MAATDDRLAPLPPEIAAFFTGKQIVVTGGGGSIGTELVEQLLAFPVAYIRVIDNNETALFNLSEHLRDNDRNCCDELGGAIETS